MPTLNDNLLKLENNYFFYHIENIIKNFKKNNPNIEILNLSIGDITIPIAHDIYLALKNAAFELTLEKSLKGYGPSSGYDFLKEKIALNDYENLNISKDEIFVSHGIKYSISNIINLFSSNNTVAICDPAYPVYVDSNIMNGNKIVYMPLEEKNNFQPKVLNEQIDIFYLCSPNNPTGIALTYDTLKSFVDYAKKNNSLILFDGAYSAFIKEKNIPKSIYEIENAKDVAIEMRSFSKNAGFTSLRLSYLVIPKNIKIQNNLINDLWLKYINVKLGNLSYLVQKAAEATYLDPGKKEIDKTIDTYMENTNLLKNGLEKLGYKTYGGINSPYVFVKTKNLSSLDFFNLLLEKANIAALPGSGFGKFGEGFVRFSGFAKKQTILKALDNLKKI
jgi:LL-diaminopimelate aminotransferase